MFSPSQDFFSLVLWPLLTSCRSLLLRTFFFDYIYLNASVRPPRVLTRSFPLYLPHLPKAIRVAIGLHFGLQTYPCFRPCMRFLFVRPEFCPLGDLSTPKIRLSSDPVSRRTPLPLAMSSRYRATSGLSPYRTCAHRAHKINGYPPFTRYPLFRFQPCLTDAIVVIFREALRKSASAGSR